MRAGLAGATLGDRLPGSTICARETRPGVPNPTRQGCLAASCATATATLLAALTSVTIALFPHHVP
ncbi:MAG TPA: hypothetical protein VF256_02465, partial [Streptosporangiaceae bacterium]